MLRSSLNDAVRLELLPRSPARGIRHPALDRVEVITLRIEEIHRLAAAVEERRRPMVYLAGTRGLRLAEIVGLRWGRVDLAGGSITVVETAPQRDSDRAEPKSRASRRNVPVTPYVAEVLREPRRLHLRAQLAPLRLESARTAASFPSLRFRDLRRSAVPLWIWTELCPSQRVTCSRLAPIEITADVYGHLFPETNDLVIARLDDALRAVAFRGGDRRATTLRVLRDR